MSIRPTLIPSRITIITQTSITIITITWINKLITAESQLQQQLTRDMWYYTSRSSSLAFIVIRDSSSFLKQDATKESREARDGKKTIFIGDASSPHIIILRGCDSNSVWLNANTPLHAF